MNDLNSQFESEPRLSHRTVIVAVAVVGIVLAFVASNLPSREDQFRVALLVLICYALAAAAWFLDRWSSWASRWFTVAVVAGAVHLSSFWWADLGGQGLLVIPIVLAATMIGFPAALAFAIGETVLLLLVPEYVRVMGPGAGVFVSLVVWGVLGMLYAAYRPLYQLSRWLEEYFERAQSFLEDARDRKAELEQALNDVAHANRQLALAGERMAALRIIAEEAQRAKTTFVANVSHEFRTPLNMIIGLVDLMIESPEIYAVALSPKMRDDLRVVHRNCEHLSNMINDVLDLTQMEAGRLVLYRERVEIRDLVEGSVEAVRPLLDKKHLAMQVTVADDLPEVYCDRTRIRQVILNLVSNAARFTEEGGITINVAEEDRHVVVSVADTGPGVSSEDAERIFEPFCQGTSELWRDKGGSGLGLSISQQFVRLHGGRMWLESTLGAGTSFFFTLPVSPPMEHIARPGYRISEEWMWREHAFRTDRTVSGEDLVKPRVVVCDESGAISREVARFAEDVEFVSALGPAQIVQRVGECPAHAVILNVSEPDDLWPLVETVGRQAPHTPIIGCCISPKATRALEAGAMGHLVKPVTRADLERAIEGIGKPVRRVLVVDDDPDVLELFTRMLHVCDRTIKVVTASSGGEALQVARDALPDAMLLDIVMSDMDGWQVLDTMAQDEAMPRVPTFFVSAQDPADEPPVSRVLMATMDEGLPLDKLLRCSLEVSALLLQP